MEGLTDTPRSRHSSRNENEPIEPDLAKLVEAWPTLPAPIRAAMLAMLGSAQAEARK